MGLVKIFIVMYVIYVKAKREQGQQFISSSAHVYSFSKFIYFMPTQ